LEDETKGFAKLMIWYSHHIASSANIFFPHSYINQIVDHRTCCFRNKWNAPPFFFIFIWLSFKTSYYGCPAHPQS